MAAVVNAEECTGCGECIDVCPVEAIVLKDEIAVVDAEECTDCEVCVDTCPTEAISMSE